MTPEEILAYVRHAFRRDVWREINQRQFINDHWGPYCWGYDTRGRVDRGMLPENRAPQFFDTSAVYAPADRAAARVDFYAFEQLGGTIGHIGSLANADFC